MLRLARPARHEGGVVHQIAVIIGVSALSGVLIAGLALPWIALAKQGAEQSANAIDDFPLELTFNELSERTKVLDSRGNRIATFYDENRKYVTLDKIAPIMQTAIIAIEDDRFYEHGAIDIKGTLRALIVNSTNAGAAVQGGSSITQQLVKLTRLENAANNRQARAASDDTFARKFEELRYAVWVEDHLSKQEILEHYLNIAYYGDGAYGIEAAAHHYFSTSASDLTLPQAAMLAGIVKNPSGYDPTLDRDAARDRRNTVLQRMLDLHLINTAKANKAMDSTLNLKMSYVSNGCVNSKTPWFCDYLLSYLMQDKSLGKTVEQRKHLIYGGGLTIKTTVDQRFQDAADSSVKNHIYPTDNIIGGLAMVEPGTGYVRALAQSRPMGNDRKKGETFLNYVVPKRYGDSNGFQPGSTFKVFVLSQAIKDHVPLNTTINATQTYEANLGDFEVCGGKNYASSDTYTFNNSTGSGPRNLYTGTRESVNTFFIQLELITGLCGPWTLAKKMGVELEDPAVNMTPSFTLGASDASPLEMAEAYATFGARGLHCASTPLLEIRDRAGEVIPTEGPDCNRVMQPAMADAVNDILQGVLDSGGFASAQNLGRDAGGKTGTTSSTKAVWFVGYTPNLATASMFAGANQQGSPISLIGQGLHGSTLYDASGSGTAAPMWGEAMRAVMQYLPALPFTAPDPEVIEGQTIAIPALAGYSPSEAASILADLGFRPQISSTVNSAQAAGTVAYTSPSGEGVSGETVFIYISNGQPPRPDPPDGGGGGDGDGDGNGNGGPGNGNGNGNGGPGNGNGPFGR